MRNSVLIGTTFALALSGLWLQGSFAAEPETDEKPTVTASVPAAAAAPAACKVVCVAPYTACKESEKVLEVLKTLITAINNHDWKTYEENLDDSCTTFDENNHKLICGKDNVIADMKARGEKYKRRGAPFVSVTIDQPYAQVNGDTAVVTFVAIREYGGKHPFKEEARATDVFIKRGDSWKKCHFRGAWKRV